MREIKIVSALVFSGIIAGCSASAAPDCSDSEAKSTVTRIVRDAAHNIYTQGGKEQFESLAKSFGMKFNDDFEGVSFGVKDTRANSYDKDIGSYSCSANLVANLTSENASVPVSYTIQPSDGGDNFYLEIKNLNNEKIGELLSVMIYEG